jgi:hypothetical protein
MMTNSLQSQVPGVVDLFPQTQKEERKRSNRQKQRLVKRRLNEVIFGKRSYLNVYSEYLQASLCFVNEGLVDPADPMFKGKAITMEMLAEIMSANQPIFRNIEEMFKEEV